jgi:hypothetical protein
MKELHETGLAIQRAYLKKDESEDTKNNNVLKSLANAYYKYQKLQQHEKLYENFHGTPAFHTVSMLTLYQDLGITTL